MILNLTFKCQTKVKLYYPNGRILLVDNTLTSIVECFVVLYNPLKFDLNLDQEEENKLNSFQVIPLAPNDTITFINGCRFFLFTLVVIFLVNHSLN